MKKTRFLFSLLMAIVMMAMSPQKVWALGGSGTSSSPFTIANENDLFEFADRVNNYSYGDKCFKLVANITLTKAWTPIGTSSNPYTGTFDGNNKTISGLNLTATAANAGFFGYVNGATIKNFTLAGTVSSGYENTGSVVGTANGSTKIYNVCSSVNITMTAAKNHIGGIMGQALQVNDKTVEIKGCTYSGTMNLGSSTDSNGGMVGFCYINTNIEIENCLFSGSISSTGSNPRIGGILGYADDDGSTQNFKYIRNCFCDGTLSPSTGQYIGIFAGYPRGKVPGVITDNTYVSSASTNMLGNGYNSTAVSKGNTAITISVTAGANGTVSHSYVNPTSTAATQLQVVATPNAHYHFRSWSDSGAQTHNVGLTANVSLSASFAIDQHTISVATNNANYGTVSGGGTFDYNSTKTITATPKTHYHFVSWNDGNTNASRTINVTEDKTYTATFEIDQHTITVNVADGQSSMGTVTGGGTYNYGTQQTITATPKEHYHFVQWNDGVKTASRQITVNGNATYTATFAIDQHTITVQANNNNYGTVMGSGTYNYGTQQTITATPKEHYHFVQWNDGVKTASRQITVTGDKTYTATFAPNPYTITVNVASGQSAMGTVSGGGTYNYGTQQTITATPKEHYHFVQWNDGDTNASRTITVNGNASYTATFAPKAKAVLNNGTLTFYYDDKDHDGVTYPLNIGTSNPNWFGSSSTSISTVVFDDSFADARPTSCYEWFYNCINLTSITGLEHLNTSKVASMGRMFYGCSQLTSLDLSSFNTSSVTSMARMFYGCSQLTSLDLSNFNTANVEYMNEMFYGCSKLTSLDLSNFNTANVEYMYDMFNGCSKLTSLDLSNFNIGSVTNLNHMFQNCSALKSLTIGNFDMQKVNNCVGVFDSCALLNTLTMKSLPFLKDGTFNTKFTGDGVTVNYELDDNSEIYTDGTNYLPAATSATFNREIVADGGMYSFIVPFYIPADQAAELGKFYQYSGHDPEVRKVYFDDIAEVSDGVVKANTAYFFKPAKDITSFTVNNPSIPRTLTIPDPEYPSVPGLYGTYSEIEVPVGAYGYAMQGAESTFVRAGYGNVLRPFRAYLWLGSGAYMAIARAFFGEEETNGIIDIDAESEHDIPAYDLSGQRVTDDYKGIVIKNGKKTMVR